MLIRLHRQVPHGDGGTSRGEEKLSGWVCKHDDAFIVTKSALQRRARKTSGYTDPVGS